MVLACNTIKRVMVFRCEKNKIKNPICQNKITDALIGYTKKKKENALPPVILQFEELI